MTFSSFPAFCVRHEATHLSRGSSISEENRKLFALFEVRPHLLCMDVSFMPICVCRRYIHHFLPDLHIRPSPRKICVPDRLSNVKSERSEVGGGHVLLRRSALALLRLSHISSGFYKSSRCGRGVFDLHGASACSRVNKNHFMSARVMHDVLHVRTTVGDFPLDVAVGRNSLSTFVRIEDRLHNTSSGRVLSALGFWSCGRTSAQVKDAHLKDDK